MSPQDQFRSEFPSAYFLDPDDPERLSDYLRASGRLPAGVTLLSADKAGEGNMNCTIRVRTSNDSFILKQSRPWLEKYPQIAAPFDRALTEARFYRLIEPSHAVAAWMPRLLWVDEQARLLALEDLGAASDFFPLYARTITIDEETLAGLTGYLSALHRLAPADATAREALANREMRALNHEHIFALPLRPGNGLDLDIYTGTPGLAAMAVALQRDADYVGTVTELGERYRTGRGTACCTATFSRVASCAPQQG